jgi:hypothetical protein
VSGDLAYRHYWRRKQLLAGQVPAFPVRHWWPDEGLCESERIYFEAARAAATLLDVGAGDLRVMHKFRAAGFTGRYDTQDIGHEFPYTFRDLAEARGPYEAILCLDVVEHLSLADGLGLLEGLAGRLAPGGTLVVQTPNARCVRHPLSTDMTHRQVYNAGDLWAFLTTLSLEAHGYRVAWGRPPRGPWGRCHALLSRYVVTRILGCDYADNLLLLARKRPRAGAD